MKNLSEKLINNDEAINNFIKFLIIIAFLSVIIVILAISAAFITFDKMSILRPTSAALEHPWNETNLTVYIDTSDMPAKDVQIYAYNALIALRWWEHSKGLQRLGYQVNFNRVDDPELANIDIDWRLNNYTTDESTAGHTFIGDPTCNINSSYFTRCRISIKPGLDDAKMQEVIEHEIGHTFSLYHSFNTSDFIVRIVF